MKKVEITVTLLLIMMLAGCATVDDLKSSVTSSVGDLTSTVTSKVASITSNVDPALAAKVPQDKRGEFPKAEYAVTVAQEKLKLAQMKSDLAEKQKKYANAEEDLVSIDMKEASLDYDMVKLSAIEAAGLGKKEDNDKVATHLKEKKVELQSDRIKADANKADIKRKMDDLTVKIKAQDEKVMGLKTENATVEKATPQKITTDTAAPEKTIPEKAAPDKVTPEQVTPENEANVAPEKIEAVKGDEAVVKSKEETPPASTEEAK